MWSIMGYANLNAEVTFDDSNLYEQIQLLLMDLQHYLHRDKNQRIYIKPRRTELYGTCANGRWQVQR